MKKSIIKENIRNKEILRGELLHKLINTPETNKRSKERLVNRIKNLNREIKQLKWDYFKIKEDSFYDKILKGL